MTKTLEMKKALLTLAMGLTLALTAATAQAGPIILTIGDSYYIGSVVKATPSDAPAQVSYINALLDLSPGDTLAAGGKTYTAGGFDCAGCDDATVTGAIKDEAPFADLTNLDLSSWTYLFLKLGDQGHVWYVAGQDDVTLKAKFGKGLGLSHFSLYNPTTTTVPDGGATLGLLGLGMVGLGFLRRRMF